MVRLPKLTAKQLNPPKIFSGNSNSVPNPKSQQCLSLLNSCSSIKHAFQIHAQILISGVSSLWNDLIKRYATSKTHSPRKALWVFLAMRYSETKPDNLTYPYLFKACATLSALNEGRQIQADVIKHGFDCDVYVQNNLIHFYGSCKKILDALGLFGEMSFRTVVSWNSIISACVENSRFYDSIEWFIKMRDCGYDPDETTMVILLSSSTELGSLSIGKWIHCQIIEKGLVLNCQLGTALVDMYAKCGALGCAGLVFDKMLERNVWTWSAMILGLAQHGFAEDALELFMKLKNSTIKPNSVTFLGVLCACSHAGLVEDGRRFFHDMEHVNKIKPLMVHYGAMVDALGRAGLIKEAYNFIRNMPFDADATIWRTLLSACKIHDINDYAGVGTKVRKKLLELEPRRGGNLVMVANKYAEAGMWEKAEQLRRSMRDRGLKKMAGESCVEVGGSIFRFLSGYDSQVACENIFLLLDRMSFHMRTINDE